MAVQLLQHWDVVIDGIQIVLCILILAYLIRNGRQSRDSARDRATLDSGQNFNAQMFTQTLKQQVDEAFANISKTMALEQAKLSNSLPICSEVIQKHETGKYASEKQRTNEPQVNHSADSALNRDPLQEKIRQLASKGKTAGQISEEVKVPLVEVELVLSLGADMDD